MLPFLNSIVPRTGATGGSPTRIFGLEDRGPLRWTTAANLVGPVRFELTSFELKVRCSCLYATTPLFIRFVFAFSHCNFLLIWWVAPESNRVRRGKGPLCRLKHLQPVEPEEGPEPSRTCNLQATTGVINPSASPEDSGMVPTAELESATTAL